MIQINITKNKKESIKMIQSNKQKSSKKEEINISQNDIENISYSNSDRDNQSENTILSQLFENIE